jgi:tRNA C32,U32 (ribose-2'-O)-methylase TrmJ
MAVNIICYEWYLLNKEEEINKNNNFDLASKDNIKHFKDFLINSMYEVGFFKKKKLDKKLEINLKNIFSKSMLTDKELLILYGVIKGLKYYKNK